MYSISIKNILIICKSKYLYNLKDKENLSNIGSGK